MKFYTKSELYEMRFDEYLRVVVDMDWEAFRLGVSGIDHPKGVVRCPSRMCRVLELQDRNVRKQANLDALKVVYASMMSLVEEGE